MKVWGVEVQGLSEKAPGVGRERLGLRDLCPGPCAPASSVELSAQCSGALRAGCLWRLPWRRAVSCSCSVTQWAKRSPSRSPGPA